MSRKALLLLAAPAALLSLSFPAQAEELRDVYMVVWDATRADGLTPYGYSRDTTPNLAKLAEKATVFKNAQASGSWTIPSVASIFTGLFAHNHKVDYAPSRGIISIPQEATTLAETFKAKGYYTALYTAQSVFYNDGYTQGFDVHEMTGSGDFKDRVVTVMEAAGDKPVFMVLYFLNPHSPYDPPKLHDIFSDPNGPQVDIVLKKEDVKDPGDVPHDDVNSGRVTLSDAQWAQLRAKYDGELRSNDQRTQNCLDRIERYRRLDDAVYILTSDHGEMFNERVQQRTWHGWPTHENQRVPLIIKAPGQSARVDVETQVRSVDIFPTLLELAGISDGPKVNGESLVPLMTGKKGKDRPNYGATHYWDGLQFYNNGTYNLIASRKNSSKQFVYDLVKDPEETVNLADSNKDLFNKLVAEAAAFVASTTIDLGVAGEGELTSEEEERLRALGYIE